MGSVKLNDITKRFGETVAVDDISITIQDGELLALLGPSGCGKTTSLRMIAGLEMPTEGRMLINEKDVTGLDTKHRDIAMVFQDLALYPHKTVRSNMGFGLEMRGYDDEMIKERIADTAELLEISDMLDRNPTKLSGGQQQRVALGRAIVRNPEVFLMDEPLSSLDAKLREQMRSEILELHQTLETTIVYVTHDQEVAMTLGDRIAVMNDGTIQQIATPNEIYQQPVNEFVAKFIGSPDMNFFEVTVDVVEETVTLEAPTFKITLDKSVAESWNKLDGRNITLGIRPQDIYQPNFLQRPHVDGEVVDATVEIVEELGAVNDAHLSVNGISFIARLHQDAEATVGEQIDLVFDMTKAHVFDPETGDRIPVSETSEVGSVEAANDD